MFQAITMARGFPVAYCSKLVVLGLLMGVTDAAVSYIGKEKTSPPKIVTTSAVGYAAGGGNSAHCPSNQGGALRFTKEISDMTWWCDDSFNHIRCCATGFSKVIWRRKVANVTDWETWPWYSDGRAYLDENNQHIVFKRVEKGDEGLYQCVAQADGGANEEISHEIDVIIQNCKVCPIPPKIVRPVEFNHTTYHLIGDNVSIPCRVVFRMKTCDNSNVFPIIRWNKVTTTDEIYIKKPRMVTVDDPVWYVKERYLNLTNITVDDFGTYFCMANDGHKSVKKWVILQEGSAPTMKVLQDPPVIKDSMIGVITLAVFLFILLPLVLWFFRLDLLLLRDAKCRKRNAADSYNLSSHDIILIHSGTRRDYSFVRQILFRHLEENMKYKVFLPERDLSIEYIDTAYINAIRSSVKIVLVLTEDFLAETLCGNINDYIIGDRRQNDVIFVQYGSISKEMWKESRINNVKVLYKSLKNAEKSWLRLGKKVKWPGKYESTVIEDQEARKLKNFWKQLTLYLPLKSEGVSDIV